MRSPCICDTVSRATFTRTGSEAVVGTGFWTDWADTAQGSVAPRHRPRRTVEGRMRRSACCGDAIRLCRRRPDQQHTAASIDVDRRDAKIDMTVCPTPDARSRPCSLMRVAAAIQETIARRVRRTLSGGQPDAHRDRAVRSERRRVWRRPRAIGIRAAGLSSTWSTWLAPSSTWCGPSSSQPEAHDRPRPYRSRRRRGSLRVTSADKRPPRSRSRTSRGATRSRKDHGGPGLGCGGFQGAEAGARRTTGSCDAPVRG